MSQRYGSVKEPAEKAVRDIRRATRKRHSPQEKIHIVLSGLGGEERTAGVADRRLHHASGAGYCA